MCNRVFFFLKFMVCNTTLEHSGKLARIFETRPGSLRRGQGLSQPGSQPGIQARMGVAVMLTPMFTKPQLNSIANSLTWVWCWIGVIVTSSTQTHYYTHVCSAAKDTQKVRTRLVWVIKKASCSRLARSRAPVGCSVSPGREYISCHLGSIRGET